MWYPLFLAGFVSVRGIASWRGNLEDFKAQRIGLVPAVIALLVAATVLLPGLQAAEFDFFEKQIRPLFHKHCYECHSTEGGKAKGGLVLDSREGWVTGGDSGPAIVPGDPGASLLIRAVSYSGGDLKMPPKYRLSEGEREALA